MDGHEGFTPAEVARRVAGMGVIADPAAVWRYLRARFAGRYPERVAGLSPGRLPVTEEDLDGWLDDFLDGVETERARLTQRLGGREPGTA
jgi:hypothetical protein